MPSSTQSHPKKRRRDEDDTDGDIHLPLPLGYYNREQHQHQHRTAPPRKIISYSSPHPKKIRINTSSEEQQPYHQRSISQHHTGSPAKQQSPPKTINLSPCHICHRKPTKKTDLDSYADCESCGERTCYICIRQCLGQRATPTSTTYDNHEYLMRDDDQNDYAEDVEYEKNWAPSNVERSFRMEDGAFVEEERNGSEARTNRGGTWSRGQERGHWGRICSQCCIEKGPQGEVVCLGCLET